MASVDRRLLGGTVGRAVLAMSMASITLSISPNALASCKTTKQSLIEIAVAYSVAFDEWKAAKEALAQLPPPGEASADQNQKRARLDVRVLNKKRRHQDLLKKIRFWSARIREQCEG